MTRERLLVAVISLIWIAMPSSLAAQSKTPPANSSAKFIFLLPDGFRGWVCMDFGVAGAAALPREGGMLVIRPHQGEVLATSDKTDAVFLYGEAWYEVAGQRKTLPDDVSLQPGPSRTGPAEPTERRCAFVGTTDERDAAAPAPGFENLARRGAAIPPEERQALEALYRATDGDHWKHRVGWLGPPGTECNWHGVGCAFSDGTSRIVELELDDNGITGTIPPEIGQLRELQSLNLGGNHLMGAIPSTLGQLGSLEWLDLSGNQLSGLLPDALIRKWLAGPLDISAETPLLTDVSEIDFESSASAVLCASQRVILRADDSVVSYEERCRNAAPDDRATFCQVKQGHIGAREFAMLAWLTEKNGFFDLKSEYYRGITHATFENTRVTRSGKTHAVSNYAGAGPFELWTIQRAIAGVATSAEWEKTGTQEKCPRW